MNRIIPIILSAGESKRMGHPKILTTISGMSFGDRIIKTLNNCGFKKIILVLGYKHEKISPYFIGKDGIDIIINNNYINGPLSSLKCAMKTLEKNMPLLLFPVDHPMVSDRTINSMIKAYSDNPDSIIIPTYEGKKGHPVIFGEAFFKELLNAPLNIGARFVVRNNREKIILVNVDDIGILRNINSPKDF